MVAYIALGCIHQILHRTFLPIKRPSYRGAFYCCPGNYDTSGCLSNTMTRAVSRWIFSPYAKLHVGEVIYYVWNFRRFYPLGSCVLDHLRAVYPACSGKRRKIRRRWCCLLNNPIRSEMNWSKKGGYSMYGGFMGDHRLTRWAIVFLIIFVLFILLVPEERERRVYCTTTPV
jgi:hypothetical protein